MRVLQIILFQITNKTNLTIPYLTNLPSPSLTLKGPNKGHLLKPKKLNLSKFQNVTPGVNFTNVLRAAFAQVDPKSVKNTVKSLMLLGSAGAKAVPRMLMKLSPD